MATHVSKTVLITGCSSGIGHATALRLAKSGWTVYASARTLDGLDDLSRAGCRLLALDVTDEASMRAAVDAVGAAEGAVGVLVNNAGYSQGGAIETVPIDQVRRQFETNVFGLIRLTQLVLPGMRRQRWGKIVNIGSMGGRLTFPGAGYYHATKYALEALTDALRFEVAGFGVDAILVEPGLVRTRFGEIAAGNVDPGAADGGPYATFNRAVAATTKNVYERGPFSRLAVGPDAVAATIERAITAPKPKARYTSDLGGKLLIAQRALMPDRLWDRFVGTQFPRPTPTEPPDAGA